MLGDRFWGCFWVQNAFSLTSAVPSIGAVGQLPLPKRTWSTCVHFTKLSLIAILLWFCSTTDYLVIWLQSTSCTGPRPAFHSKWPVRCMCTWMCCQCACAQSIGPPWLKWSTQILRVRNHTLRRPRPRSLFLFDVQKWYLLPDWNILSLHYILLLSSWAAQHSPSSSLLSSICTSPHKESLL